MSNWQQGKINRQWAINNWQQGKTNRQLTKNNRQQPMNNWQQYIKTMPLLIAHCILLIAN
jgi:hypothetical protein